MSDISNKSYSHNFIIDSNVIWRNIFYDNSVNFLCTYLFLYTAGMCDVTYIGVYIYLHGRCFLSALYNDIKLVSRHMKSTLLFVSSDTSSHLYAISRSTSQRRDLHHTSCRNTTWSLFVSAANTLNTRVVFLLSKASAPNV